MTNEQLLQMFRDRSCCLNVPSCACCVAKGHCLSVVHAISKAAHEEAIDILRPDYPDAVLRLERTRDGEEKKP